MHNMVINMHKCVSKQSSMNIRWKTKQKIVARWHFVHPGLLWALWVLALVLGILELKPNGAPQAALHMGFGLGIKIRMIGEYTGTMIMEHDIFFMFYPTIFSVLCYMNTYLTTRLVASAYGMFECTKLPEVVLQITLNALDARDHFLVLNWHLWIQDNEGQVASKVKCVIMSLTGTICRTKLHRSLQRLHTVSLHTHQHNF